jgi:hypothetical protein
MGEKAHFMKNTIYYNTLSIVLKPFRCLGCSFTTQKSKHVRKNLLGFKNAVNHILPHYLYDSVHLNKK